MDEALLALVHRNTDESVDHLGKTYLRSRKYFVV